MRLGALVSDFTRIRVNGMEAISTTGGVTFGVDSFDMGRQPFGEVVFTPFLGIGSEVYTAYVPSPRGAVFMTLIEKTFGKDLTTRTWDTVKKCAAA